MLTAHQLSKSYDIQPLFQDISFNINPGERVGLIGPNGCGKTALLRILAGEERPDGGHVKVAPGLRIGYLPQGFELDPKRTVAEVVGEAAGDPEALEGEVARLALALLVAQGCNFLLLDEPINHLDIPSRSRFEEALAHFEGTTLAVVHDRAFIERFASDVWLVEGQGIRRQIRDV